MRRPTLTGWLAGGDIGEKNNLAAKTPQKAAELQRKLAAWRESVDAKMPTPNPDYDPARANEWGGQQQQKRGEGILPLHLRPDDCVAARQGEARMAPRRKDGTPSPPRRDDRAP